MTHPIIISILHRLEPDQVKTFNNWQKKGTNEIDAIISAILREQPPAQTAESARGKMKILQENGLHHITPAEIRDIVKKERSRPAASPAANLRASFEHSFIKQGKTLEQAGKMADIAADSSQDARYRIL